jgi:hypothetical protein
MVQNEVRVMGRPLKEVAAATDRAGCRGGESDVDHIRNSIDPIHCEMVMVASMLQTYRLLWSSRV